MAKSRLKVGKLALKAKLLDGLRDAILLVNDHLEVVDHNKAAQELLWDNADDPPLTEVIQDKQLLNVTRQVLKTRRPGSAEVSIPYPIGKTFEVTVTPLPHRERDKIWAMLTLHDVTETRRLERVRSDFVSNVSHELRSPLSSLMGFIETLQGPAKDKPEDRDRFLNIMADETRRMTRLVEDLLSLSRVETREHRQPEGRVRIGDLVDAAISRLNVRARKRDMTIDVVCTDPAIMVRGDEDQLNQLVENLLDNALKYGNRGTAVEVCIAAVDMGLENGTPTACLSVRDHGPGIDPHHLDRLTERFYRVDEGRSRAIGGTGLGLALVKHIINRHRGRLRIESTVNDGSTFTVLLPRIPKPNTPESVDRKSSHAETARARG